MSTKHEILIIFSVLCHHNKDLNFQFKNKYLQLK